MNFIDLFAGAGGLSEGFIRSGYKPVAHIEKNTDASFTLKTRLAYYYLLQEKKLDIYYDYISNKISRQEFYSKIPEDILKSVINEEISEKTINKMFEKIDSIKRDNKIKNIDLVIGGPPCQAYSLVGRARNSNKSEEEKKKDLRNYLYKFYIEFLDYYNPIMIVFENVPGLLSAGNKKYFHDLKNEIEKDYKIYPYLLDSSLFGVLQKRKRIIIIGYRKDLRYKFPEFEFVDHNFNVNHILSDLPVLEPGEEKNVYKRKTNKYLEIYKIRNEKFDILTQNISRPHNDTDRKIYKIAINLWNTKKRRLKYSELPERLKNHKNEISFEDRFKVVDKDGLCHTLVAHIAKDGHYYIHPDINQLRSITVREAARIQSFSDNYFFEGSRTSAFQQIGNAVPPLMAENIARKLKKEINNGI